MFNNLANWLRIDNLAKKKKFIRRDTLNTKSQLD